MAETKKYYHNLDVDNNKISNLLLNPVTTAQRTSIGATLGLLDQGYVTYDTDLNKQYFWNGTIWIESGTTLLLTTLGTSGAATLIGSTLNIPQYSGGFSQWTTISTGIYYNSGNVLIGKTVDAGYKLDVVGNTYLKGSNYFEGITVYLPLGAAYGGMVLNYQQLWGNGDFKISWSPTSGTWYNNAAPDISIIRSGTSQLKITDGLLGYGSLGVGSIGINTISINASAALQIDSTTKGLLTARMTTVQRNNIVSPSTGLSIYNTTTNTHDYYNGAAWVSLGTGVGSQSLQQVTDIGNITTNSITVGDSTFIKNSGTGFTGNLNVTSNGISADRLYDLPDGSGTLVLSVNAEPADVDGGISINLQSITDIGNSTTNDIIVTDNGDNTSTLSPFYLLVQNSDSVTHSYLVDDGSLRLKTSTNEGQLRNTNSSTGSVTLEFPDKISGSYTIATIDDIFVPNLDQVTTVGSVTTNDITANSFISTIAAAPGFSVRFIANEDSGFVIENQSGRQYLNASGFGFLTIAGTSVGTYTTLNGDWLTGNRLLYFPNETGTITLSVNGNTADIYGNVTIPSFTSPLTTKGDIYVRNASTDTRLPVGLDTQILLADSTQPTGLKWGTNTATTPTGYYGGFQDVTNQTAAVINTGYPMLLGITDLSNGISIISGSRVTIANTGIYNIQWSAQFTNPTAAEHDVTIWLRKNGVDVPGSAGIVLVPAKHGASDGHVLPSWNFLLDVVGGDYYEFVWSTDNTSVYISFQAAGNPPPSTASVVLTVTQQSGIMAGTGMTALNGLTGAVQTLAIGTSGISPAFTSVGTTHTLDIPLASGTGVTAGLLSNTDYNNFGTRAAGGSFVSYYFNGSVAASVATYYQMSPSANIAAAANFTLAGNGLISQWLSDVGNPNRLEIPAGNWNFEMYMSASSAGGTPAFYIELLKYNGSTFTTIANSSAAPKNITGGTSIDLYLTSLAIPQTTLLVTDRLAIRVYIVNSIPGRSVTMYTQDSHVSEVITNFAGGISALNGLTVNTQYFATGTSGTDFNISSVSPTHTFNLPTASATNRGALSTTDWSAFNNKQSAISLTTTGSSGASTFISNTLNVPTYTLSGLGGQPLAINLTSLSGLTYASTSFVKMTAAGTFALDTNTYQGTITLTTTGTSGAATLIANTLNIPQYSGGGGGGITYAEVQRLISIGI